MFGLDTDTLRSIKEALAGFTPIEKVIVYGSRAMGNYKNGSDIDITLLGKGLNLSGTIYPLQEKLDELYLPYTFDISIFGQLDNQNLIEHILRVGKTFYQRERGALPKGWEVRKLGEVCENLDSKRIPITKNKREAGYIPYYGASGIVDYVADYLFDEDLLLVSEDGANLLMRTYPIAFSISGKTWVNNHAHVLRFKNMLNQRFVELYLNSMELNNFVSGMAQPKLNQKKLHSIPVPLPPLTEQKRIVTILDEAFAAIDKAKTNAEKNLQNSKELFESFLNGVFADPGEDWEERKLGEVCEVIAGQSPEGKYYNKGGDGLPFYQGKKEFTEKYIGQPTIWTTEITKEAEKNDILMSVRAPVGPINFSTQKICIGRGLAAIRVSSLINKEFLFSFLLRHENKIVGNAGAVFNSINKSQIEAINIPLPPLSEQKRIVSRLNKLSAETKKLEAIYQKKIANLEELKKSLLERAFAGEM